MPTLLDTRAAIGTAETPAEPMSGLIFPASVLANLFITFAMITPEPVPILKAMRPSTMMPKVSAERNLSACSFEPTARPSMMVTILMSSLAAVLDRRSTTPHSLNRLPNISIPTSGVADGSSRAQIISTESGKTIFSIWRTGRSCFISISRSALVVSRRMIGGWIMGTSAM